MPNLRGTFSRVTDGALGSVGRSPGEAAVDPDPYAHFCDPASAYIGGPDVTLKVRGAGFKACDVIVFNAGEEATTFVDSTTLTTIVKPSPATVAGAFPVQVRRGGFTSRAAHFGFLPAEENPNPPAPRAPAPAPAPTSSSSSSS